MKLSQLVIAIIFLIGSWHITAQKKRYYDYETNHVIDSVRSEYPLMDFNGDSIPDKIRIKSSLADNKMIQEIYFIESLNDSVMLQPKLIKIMYPQENIGAVLKTNKETNKIDLIEVKKYQDGVAKEYLSKNVNDSLQKPILIGVYDPKGNYTSIRNN